MTTIVTYAGKGSQLTTAEADANFNNLNNDKAEVSALTGKAAAGANSDITSLTALTPGGIPAATITQSTLASNVAGTGPAFSAYLPTANQTLTAGSDTVVACSAKEFDTNTNYNTSTYRFTPTVAGYYLISGRVFLGDSTGTVSRSIVSIYKNGVVAKSGDDVGDANGYGLSISALIFMNGTTDYVDLRALCVCTTAIARFGSGVTYFQGVLVRAA
jgi:hypothetical protein